MGGRKKRSKKLSDGSRPPQSQLENLVIYLDENLCNCQPVIDALKSSQVLLERHLAHWPTGTPDQDWLPKVGEKQWVLLTKDQNIRYNALERNQVIRARVREFVIVAGNANKYELAEILKRALPAIQKLCRRQDPPFIATITKTGAVHLRVDKNGPLSKRGVTKGK